MGSTDSERFLAAGILHDKIWFPEKIEQKIGRAVRVGRVTPEKRVGLSEDRACRTSIALNLKMVLAAVLSIVGGRSESPF